MTFMSLVVSVALCGIAGPARAGADNPSQPAARQPVVRLAELRIDPSQLELYRAALREEIEASVRLEPGVLTLYAVSVKGDPSQVRIFEVYADAAAYEAHLQTSHFKKYKTGTRGMVKSLVLVETDPIVLGAKRND